MNGDSPKKPHWAIPHVIGVALAIAAYIAIYAYTGDGDLLIAIATGAVGMAGTWVYLFSGFGRK